LADQEKIGTPWGDDELDAIIADYFAMLDAELSRRPYVKSRHSAALMERTGRTHRSVEFKHQNISAVLEELGLPRIRGYKPKPHYQGALFGAIDRYLSAHVDVAYRQAPAVLDLAEEDDAAGVFTAPPALLPSQERPVDQHIRIPDRGGHVVPGRRADWLAPDLDRARRAGVHAMGHRAARITQADAAAEDVKRSASGELRGDADTAAFAADARLLQVGEVALGAAGAEIALAFLGEDLLGEHAFESAEAQAQFDGEGARRAGAEQQEGKESREAHGLSG